MRPSFFTTQRCCCCCCCGCCIPLYLVLVWYHRFVCLMYTSSSTTATCLSIIVKFLLLLLLLCLQPSLSFVVTSKFRRPSIAAKNGLQHDNEIERMMIPQALQQVQSSQSPPLPIFQVLDQVCASLVDRYVDTRQSRNKSTWMWRRTLL